MWRIDRLEGHGEQAWEWFERLPEFLKWGDWTKEEYIESFERGENFGGWSDGLKVIVHGEGLGETMEGHLLCDPKADTQLIAATISYGVKAVKKRIIIETPSRHRTIRNILTSIGFKDLGLFAYRGQAVETCHYLYE